MATIPEIIILGIIQGITEWLPVSSSGHLVLVQEFFQIKQPLVFDVMLHFGTLIVILVVFRRDIERILKALTRRDFASEDGKLAGYVIIGTIPAVIIGYLFHDFFQSLFQNALAVSVALLFTGCLLFVSERRLGNRPLGFVDSVLIGVAQAVSIIPGISRSGATISAGLLRGVEKERVFRFSFLLSVPVILGATAFEAKNIAVQEADFAAMFLGMIVSIVVGYFALKALMKIVLQRRFHYFAYYCWVLGLGVIVLLLL
ncbi:MAG: undecaprenyl-diphosphate phosphatase [Candidatus Bathyarchaeia archaeon]|jgi:undecaprenyl-diphosphatase|nr:undecaprenyl-diphosphate phosphatase [Candidatus Bathyarchaeota archaeon A05DMB-4]MDH7594911.1 undecaprenyl-diphosphate phosphatase [Candidatus Bathyarchaeota archaeon]